MTVFGLCFMLIIVGCGKENTTNDTNEPITLNKSVNQSQTGFEGITKQQCVQAGGNWNECGSPCSGTNADFCVEMCQVQCECGGFVGFKCPKGYKCRLSGKKADEIGVCVEG